MSLIDKACWMSEDLEKRGSEPEAAELLYSCADELSALRERVRVLEDGLRSATDFIHGRASMARGMVKGNLTEAANKYASLLAPPVSVDGGIVASFKALADDCTNHENGCTCPICTPNDGEEYPMSDELRIWKSRADAAENEAARLSDELKIWKSRADAAENEAARLSDEKAETPCPECGGRTYVWEWSKLANAMSRKPCRCTKGGSDE